MNRWLNQKLGHFITFPRNLQALQDFMMAQHAHLGRYQKIMFEVSAGSFSRTTTVQPQHVSILNCSPRWPPEVCGRHEKIDDRSGKRRSSHGGLVERGGRWTVCRCVQYTTRAAGSCRQWSANPRSTSRKAWKARGKLVPMARKLAQVGWIRCKSQGWAVESAAGFHEWLRKGEINQVKQFKHRRTV